MKNITIAGNVTRDAELRTAGSSQVAGFSIAVNGFANGEKTAHFFEISIWGKRGESVIQFAKKGAKMSVSGDFGTREYNGKTILTINASDFTPMGGRSDNQGDSGGYGGSDQGGGYGGGQGNQGGGFGGGSPAGGLDDEIPFAMEWRA